MKTTKTFLTLIAISVCVGSISSNIPWGNENEVHGYGFPIFTGVWQRDESGQIKDYVNGIGIYANIAFYFFLSFLLFRAWKLMRWMLKLSKAKKAINPGIS